MRVWNLLTCWCTQAKRELESKLTQVEAKLEYTYKEREGFREKFNEFRQIVVAKVCH